MRCLTIRSVVALAALPALGACKGLDVPNYTSASIELLESNPTPAVISTVAIGMLRAVRGNQALQVLDTYGRNSYNMDPSEVRSVTVPLIGPLDPSTGATSWGGHYTNIRNGFAIIGALDKVGAQLTDPQKAGFRGFAKTWMAWELHQLIRQTDTFGAVIDVVNATPTALAPFVSKAAVYAQIEAWMNEANTELGNAGAAFAFNLTPGFSLNGAMNTVAGFRQLNRALMVKVLADQGQGLPLGDGNGKYAAALAILNTAGATFLNTTMTAATAVTSQTAGVLNIGAYHTYSTNPGDATHGLYDQTGRALLAHPSLLTDAQLNGAVRDLRYTRKVLQLTVTRSLVGVSSNLRFQIYEGLETPIPIIRNEELILIRAEARLQTGDRAGALADVNLIRTLSGGLTTIAADPGAGGTFSGDLLLDDLLYNKRYSLVYENGHRWVDLRKYGLLGRLPRQQAIHVMFERRPLPEGECSLRPTPKPAGCVTVQGLTTGPVVP